MNMIETYVLIIIAFGHFVWASRGDHEVVCSTHLPIFMIVLSGIKKPAI